MILSCLQENLVKGLNYVSRAVAAHTATLPVLTHVMLATDGGRLKIAATNLELGINCWIGAKVEDEGAITVPARLFSELVGLLPSGRVDLDLNIRTQTLRIQCGYIDNYINGIDAQEFPIIPAFDPAGAAFIDAAVLKKLIGKVVFSAATDDSRPMLTGVHTRLEEDNITMATADQFRLSVCNGKLKEPIAEPRSILIPARAMAEVARILDDQEEPIAISISPSRGQVLFHMHNVDVVSQLIDQRFFDYKAIIPSNHVTRTIFNTADMLKACRQASIFARESSDTMRLVISPSGNDEPGKIVISARADEKGNFKNQLEALATGSEIEIAFNVKFLIDVLSVIDEPQTSIETSLPKAPGVIRPVGDDTFVHVIMPMHLPR